MTGRLTLIQAVFLFDFTFLEVSILFRQLASITPIRRSPYSFAATFFNGCAFSYCQQDFFLQNSH